MYDLNDSMVFAVSTKDGDGDLTDPTTIVLTVTAPDGTVTTPSPSNAAVGEYEAVVLADQAGQWRADWVATGPNAAYSEIANVRLTADRMLISLIDAREHLNLTATAADEEVRETILVASRAIENIVGPVLPDDREERHRGRCEVLSMDHRIVAVTTVTEHPGGVVPAATGSNRGYRREGSTGLVLYSGETPMLWASRVVISYRAGLDVEVPPNIRQATRELVRHLWNTQRGPLAPRTMESESFYPGMSFTMPRRVIELLDTVPAVV